MRVEERVYRALLLCYSREFRDEYGAETESVFRERRREEIPLLLWLHVLADIGITAPKERLDTFLGDVSYAFRTFLKDPAFAAMAVLALALGIGVNSAMFSIIDSVLLRGLPFNRPDKLAMIWQPAPLFKLGTQYIAASTADFYDWKTQNRTFAHLAGFSARRANLSISAQPESVAETQVTGDFFSVLGTPPLLGAPIIETNEAPGNDKAAVLSYRLWKDRFNGKTAVVGKKIRLDGETYTVTGVMPEEFRFPEGNEMPALYGLPAKTDLWVPISYSEVRRHDRNNHALLVIARIRSGITLAQAQTDLEIIQQQLSRLYPSDDRDFGVLVTPLTQIVVGSFRTELLLLFAAVGFVLLIACANVANLLLARATVRRREIAIRTALGAPRPRLFRQLLTESLFLSLLGAAAGLIFAAALLRVVLSFAPATIPRLQETRLDLTVVAYAVLVSIATGVLFGIFPAFQLVFGELAGTLQQAGARGQVGGGVHVRKILVIAEVALAVTLLIGAGLALRSLSAVEKVNPGFKTEKVITMNLVLPDPKYKEQGSRRIFFEQALQKVMAIPGRNGAGLVSALPLSNNENLGGLDVKGKTTEGHSVVAERRWASEGYFSTLGIPLLAGRYFNAADGNSQAHSAIINEAVKRRFFANENPLGQQVKIGHEWLTVVGVTGDVHNSSLESSPRLQVYLYYASRTPQSMSLVVRASQESSQILSSVRRAVATVDPDQAVADIKTMDELLNGSVSARLFSTTIVAVFGLLALILTVVGLYSVVTYNIAQRSREIGLRIALGAMRSDILTMVLRDALTMTGTGLLIGTIAALFAASLAARFVYGVPVHDPMTFCGISALLLLVTVMAAYFPGRRAASTDPNVVLRHE